MAALYNKIQGRSLERLAALSDGIFAVAMTLLVLDIHIPLREGIHLEADLLRALCGMAPQWVAYLMSFLTLGIFWAGQQTQLNHLREGDRDLTWIHLGFLFAVTLMPLTTRLLAEFIEFRGALVLYWFNILLAGAMLYWSWMFAARHELIKEDTAPEVQGAICRRILIAQSLYAFGALLCVVSNYVSIGFIVLVQLNYAIAPRFGRRLG
jgi:uncharacterized membrane protein